jgi:hypothetical protein
MTLNLLWQIAELEDVGKRASMFTPLEALVQKEIDDGNLAIITRSSVFARSDSPETRGRVILKLTQAGMNKLMQSVRDVSINKGPQP